MKSYALELYRQMFASLNRGNIRGVYSDAKPIFWLSVIDYIPYFSEHNKLRWQDNGFKQVYSLNFCELSQQKETPLWKPFFYSASEPFYTLVWNKMPDEKSIKHPSGKTLKDFLDFAMLDDELWELLQEEGNRQYLRQCIIDQYLTDK